MILVDSCGWLEYLSGGPNADSYAPALETRDPAKELLVPAICLFEVFKRVLPQGGERAALHAAALMQQGLVVDLTESLALAAAKLSHELEVPMADSIIVATARAHKAVIWTQDADFKGLDGVRFIGKA